MNITVSVAMTTYNGEKYIGLLLQSIFEQSRKPDEVIICDDLSSDGTVEVVRHFIDDYSLNENWKLIVNKKKLGWKANFYNAILQTTGDVVFFSDQDDIWFKDKIEVMTTLMIENKMGCLSGLKRIIDQDGNLIKERMEKQRFSNQVSLVPFTPAFYTYKNLGCCMCVSRDIINKYIEIGAYEDCHDSQSARIALLFGTTWELNRPVIDYRIHISNTSGIDIKKSYGASNLKNRISQLEDTQTWLSKTMQILPPGDERINLIEKTKAVVAIRCAYLLGKKGNFITLFRHRRYYANFSMLIGDFAYRHGINNVLGVVRWKLRKR